jgi:hypothetical protein
MATRPRKTLIVGMLLSFCWFSLATSTSPVYALPVTSVRATSPSGRQPLDFLAALVGGAVGGALAGTSSIAAALGGAAAAGAVGGVVGVAVAVGLNAAYNAGTYFYNAAAGAFSMYATQNQGPPIDQQLPFIALPRNLLD